MRDEVDDEEDEDEAEGDEDDVMSDPFLPPKRLDRTLDST